MKPPYYKPAILDCEICYRPLSGKERYRVKFYLKIGKLKAKVYVKTIHVCEDCLREILNNEKLKRKYHITYRKMRKLT